MSNVPNEYTLWKFNCTPVAKQNAAYSTKKTLTEVSEKQTQVQPKLMETVKDTTKSLGYLSVIIFGVGFMGMIGYTMYQELVSSKSPNVVYSKALERCISHPKVVRALGEPIKAHGEGGRRGYRTHISHNKFIKDNKLHMKMKFHLEGKRHGKVVLEVKENDAGDFEYNYLYVIADDIARSVICIEDNRLNASPSGPDSQLSLF